MTSFKNVLLASSLLLSVTAQASIILPANTLLDNGGFEAPDIGDNSWEYYTNSHNAAPNAGVPGWSYEGSGMEIWDSLLGVDAIEGEQHAELNAHGASNEAYSFRQTFDTVEGQIYDYGFAYKARNNSEESFDVEIMGINLNTIDDHTTGDWMLFTGTFIATGYESTIAFTSRDTVGDTTGNLLDAVYVTARSVPEPSSVFLLGLGLLGLSFRRRK